MDTEEMVARLDRLYWTDMQEYIEYLNRIKSAGYKVLRNSKGKHKIDNSWPGMFNDFFGGAFK